LPETILPGNSAGGIGAPCDPPQTIGTGNLPDLPAWQALAWQMPVPGRARNTREALKCRANLPIHLVSKFV
jgi:hypothetical protein